MTAGSTTIGTFGYMPVEQLAGEVDSDLVRPIGARTENADEHDPTGIVLVARAVAWGGKR